LIDSSVFVAAERGDAPLQVAFALKRPYEDSFLSVVTVGELLHGVYRAKDQATRNRREAWVEGILGEIPVLPYDERVARVLAPLDA
jgi:tRNA(fMet)-specific endonuclease VapC